jgi:hypothetical protein
MKKILKGLRVSENAKDKGKDSGTRTGRLSSSNRSVHQNGIIRGPIA